ncbi:hypothetical protein BDW75DRAFT_205725 [Aspergillus navahoensis]
MKIQFMRTDHRSARKSRRELSRWVKARIEEYAYRWYGVVALTIAGRRRNRSRFQ